MSKNQTRMDRRGNRDHDDNDSRQHQGERFRQSRRVHVTHDGMGHVPSAIQEALSKVLTTETIKAEPRNYNSKPAFYRTPLVRLQDVGIDNQDHLNISSTSRQALGRIMSVTTPMPIKYQGLTALSIELLELFFMTGCHDKSILQASGLTLHRHGANERRRWEKLRGMIDSREPFFKHRAALVMDALWERVKSQPLIVEALRSSSLPFDCYREEEINQSQVEHIERSIQEDRKDPSRKQYECVHTHVEENGTTTYWHRRRLKFVTYSIVDTMSEIRRALIEDREPDLLILVTSHEEHAALHQKHGRLRGQALAERVARTNAEIRATVLNPEYIKSRYDAIMANRREEHRVLQEQRKLAKAKADAEAQAAAEEAQDVNGNVAKTGGINPDLDAELKDVLIDETLNRSQPEDDVVKLSDESAAAEAETAAEHAAFEPPMGECSAEVDEQLAAERAEATEDLGQIEQTNIDVELLTPEQDPRREDAFHP